MAARLPSLDGPAAQAAPLDCIVMSGRPEAPRAMSRPAVVANPVERVHPTMPAVVAGIAVLAWRPLASEPSGLHVRING